MKKFCLLSKMQIHLSCFVIGMSQKQPEHFNVTTALDVRGRKCMSAKMGMQPSRIPIFSFVC